MRNEITNLLPPDRQRSLARDYYLRLSVVIVWFVFALTLISMVLLVPTYIFLTDSARTKEKYLATVESSITSADEASLSARLTSLNNSATTLVLLAQAPSASAFIRAMLALPRPGVTLSQFVYTPPTMKGPGTLLVSGTAATRDALRTYQLALENAPFAQSAALPVSAYAKDRDIAFTITITLEP